jgi:nicotinate-nucleotide pyrophosphorylase (carboxylating)
LWIAEKRLSKDAKSKTMFVPRKILEEKLTRLVAEDVGLGDVTSAAVVDSDATAEAEIVVNTNGVVAGIEEVSILAEAFGLKVNAKVKDGEDVSAAQQLLIISGNARTILVVERTILNLLSRMSGIATTTRKLVRKLLAAKSKTRVAATRKTAPGLLYFDKKAVALGGGDPHRLHLDDLILIKDNHIVLVGGVEKALEKAKQSGSFSKKIEIEVTNPADALKAAELGADIVMFDNFSHEQIKKSVCMLKKAGFFGKILLEASGGINEDNFLEYALSEIDLISLGSLTHSAKGLDISLEIRKKESP